MAFQSYTLNNIEDVPAKIVDFVTNNMSGWSAANDANAGPNGEVQATVTIPGTPDRTIRIRAWNSQSLSGNRSNNSVRFLDDGGSLGFDAVLFSPVYATGTGSGDGAPRLADKLYLFGHVAPAGSEHCGLSGVISYGFNRYRHFHIGRLEKHGTWDDALVMACSNALNKKPYSGYSAYSAFDDYWPNMFRGFRDDDNSQVGHSHSGGVVINSADDSHTERVFHMSNFNGSLNLDDYGVGDEAFGGPQDGTVDGILKGGFAPSGDANIFFPVEIFSNNDDGAGGRFYRPLGRVVGAFMTNMTNFQPEQTVLIGSDEYMVFPEAHWDPTTTRNVYQSGAYWPDEESSAHFAWAYLK